MNNRIKVVRQELYIGNLSFTGYVDNHEVIHISDHIQRIWTVGSSCCLPSNIEMAQLYVECMAAVMENYQNENRRNM